MNALKIPARYIKDQTGTKTENHVTSVNITADQRDFLKRNNVNVSLVTRDAIDALMRKAIK